MLRQEKVAKKKATPGCAVGYANFPALLEGPGGLRNSPAAQTTQADFPRPFSVARRFTRGPERRDGSSRGEIIRWLRSTGKNGKKLRWRGALHPTSSPTPSLPRRRESRQCVDSCLCGSDGAIAQRAAPIQQPNQSANQPIPSHQQVMTAHLFNHGRLAGPLERC